MYASFLPKYLQQEQKSALCVMHAPYSTVDHDIVSHMKEHKSTDDAGMSADM